MFGAILGDMIGAPYEFDRGMKTKDFPLFSKFSQYTDDSVMTIAVADALLKTSPELPDTDFCREIIKSMKYWGKKYPDRQLYFKGRQHVLIKKTLLLKLMVVRCFLPISIFSKYEMMT